ncbi:MAG: type II secretion system protein [Candidatus Eisenbacteria bacterium]
MQLRADPKSSGKARQGGFTLIELVIVVTILGILASLAVPNYMRARERARRASCFSNQSHLLLAGSLYAADHKVWNEVVNSGTLWTLGYVGERCGDCPDDLVENEGDYDVTIADGQPISVQCLVNPAEHQLH